MQAETKNVMRYDLLKPVSQGSDGTHDEENRRIQKITNELRRLCCLYEKESGNSPANGNQLKIEQRITEQFAKEHGCWIPIERIGNLGEPDLA